MLSFLGVVIGRLHSFENKIYHHNFIPNFLARQVLFIKINIFIENIIENAHLLW